MIDIIDKVWRKDDFAPVINERKIIIINKDQATLLRSDGKSVQNEEIESLTSSQEKTDTRVALYCNYAKEKGYATALLHYASSLDPTRILSPVQDRF